MHEPVEYWIDPEHRILRVSDAWDAFAEANEGSGIGSGEIIGRDLLAFIADPHTRLFVKASVQSLRLFKKDRSYLYRCDSPGIRRYMNMRLRLDEGGEIRFTSECVRIERPSYEVAFLPAQERSAATRCSICNRLEREGQWVDMLEEEEISPEDRGKTFYVTYDICDFCSGRLRVKEMAAAFGGVAV